MPHFILESLGHGPGGFVEGTTRDTGQSILGGPGVESGLSTRNILNRIQDLVDRNLVQSTQFQFENVQVPLFNLGEASKNISDALNENITIRENQRVEINDALKNNALFTTSVQEQLNEKIGDFQKQINDIGKGGLDPIKFFTDNPFLGGIGIGGLAVGAVILLVLLK